MSQIRGYVDALYVPSPDIGAMKVPNRVRKIVSNWIMDPCYDLVVTLEAPWNDNFATADEKLLRQFRSQLKSFHDQYTKHQSWMKLAQTLTEMENLGILPMAEQMIEMQRLLRDLKARQEGQ